MVTPPGRQRLQLTLRTGHPPHCAPPDLLSVGANGMVPSGGMEHPPCPLLRAPPETTELLLLGARPPQGPLAHFTLRWQEGREDGEKGEEGGHIPSPGPEYPMGASPTCSLSGLRPRGQKSPKENPRGWLQGKFSLDSAPDLTLTPPFSRGPGPSAHSTHGACLTRTTALHGAVGSCRALGTGRVAASLVQVQALLTLGAEVVAEAGLAVLNLAF